MNTTLSTTQKSVNTLYLVVIDKCTRVGSAAASFKDLITFAQENTANLTAEVLVKDQPLPPLDLVKVS